MQCDNLLAFVINPHDNPKHPWYNDTVGGYKREKNFFILKIKTQFFPIFEF